MSILKTSLVSFGLLAATSLGALAYDHGSIDRTQARQAQEIEQLRRSGQLTRREYHALQSEQARIADIEQYAKRDGYLSPREHRQIREAQREAGSHIYEESHNGRVNYWRLWKWNHGFRY